MSEGSPKPKKDHWFKDWLTYGASSWFAGLPLVATLIILVVVVFVVPSLYKAKGKIRLQGVVIYTSQDQVYAEPILEANGCAQRHG